MYAPLKNILDLIEDNNGVLPDIVKEELYKYSLSSEESLRKITTLANSADKKEKTFREALYKVLANWSIHLMCGETATRVTNKICDLLVDLQNENYKKNHENRKFKKGPVNENIKGKGRNSKRKTQVRN